MNIKYTSSILCNNQHYLSAVLLIKTFLIKKLICKTYTAKANSFFFLLRFFDNQRNPPGPATHDPKLCG